VYSDLDLEEGHIKKEEKKIKNWFQKLFEMKVNYSTKLARLHCVN
jgi:hypothetical protein